MRIGIWGSYDKGNFGDDLMALMVSGFLKSKGIEPVLFRASKGLIEESAVESIDSLDHFVASTECVVIGGGGMLINNSVVRFLIKKVALEFEVSFYSLYKSLKKHKKQLYAVSVGGAGNKSLNNPFKQRLFTKPICGGGTVRLQSDLDIVDNSLFKFLPDIVLSSNSVFKGDGVETDTVVLNLKAKNGDSLAKSLLSHPLAEKYSFVTFGSHLESVSGIEKYEFKYKKSHFQHENVRDSLAFLSRSKAIVSSKLHVGVAGLAYGSRFISYKGPGKATEFLNSVGLEKYITSDLDYVISLLGDLNNYPVNRVELSISQSFGHYTELEKYLGGY